MPNDRLRQFPLPELEAVELLADHGPLLRDRWRLPWDPPAEQAVLRRRMDGRGLATPRLVAIVGGASSGKSTLFDNLLDGHQASRVTARGHSTCGLILATHEKHRATFESLRADRLLFPRLAHRMIELDDNHAGSPETLSIVFHTIDSLADTWLLDTPDMTSEAARLEGDVTLALLPWFDALILVADHERWFDRQTFSGLRARSVRLGQQRFVVFNQTRESLLDDGARARLVEQADRWSARDFALLEFRFGRGLCRFPPAALDAVRDFLAAPNADRTAALRRAIGEAAQATLNQNLERTRRFEELSRSTDELLARSLPSARDCLTALMTPAERRQLDLAWRILRVTGTREWLDAQAARLQSLFRRVPIMSEAIGAIGREATPAAEPPRASVAQAHALAVFRRFGNDLRRAARSSRFWQEITDWTDLRPPESVIDALPPADAAAIDRAALDFDRGIAEWNARVDRECHGMAPHVKAGVGVGILGLAVVLIAVPGPVTALTALAAKGAIGAAWTQLLTAGGAAALFGKPIGRFVEVARERLLGTTEFEALSRLAENYRAILDQGLRRLAGDSLAVAEALVLPADAPIAAALERLCDEGDG